MFSRDKALLDTGYTRTHTYPGCNFYIAQVLVRCFVRIEHLPLQDSKAPDIRGGGEGAVCDALRRHPSHGARYVGLHVVD